MKLLPSLACGFAAATISACATEPTVRLPGASLPVEAAAAAFRTVFADNASALRANAAIYCIGTTDNGVRRDPDRALIASLSDVRPHVVPLSQCSVSERVVDRAGRPSLMFTVEPMSCSATECVVRAGYYEGNISSQFSIYTVRNTGGRWMVDPSATELGPIS